MRFRPFMHSILIFCIIMLIGLSGCAPSSTSDGTSPPDNLTLLADLIKTSNLGIDGFDVTVDNSDPSSPKLRIASGLVNNISGNLVRITIDIDQSKGITTSPASFTVVATKFISPHEAMTDLVVTFGEEEPVSYAVITAIGGAPVNSWFAGDNLSSYVAATFGSQGSTPSITGTNLSIAGFTNSPTGAGEIKFALPEGFTATPDSITLSNPTGTEAATSTPNPDTFTIAETGNTNNSVEYTIADVPLAALTRFTPGLHVKITEGDSTPPGTDITSTLAISGFVRTEDGSNVIRIEGLTNKAGLNKYTLTIAEVTDLFTTPGNTPITRTIAEPNGAMDEFDFSPGTDGAITDPMDSSAAPTVSLTNSSNSEATIYTLEVVFRGAPVSEWFTATDLSKYIIRVGFAGIDANPIILNEAMKQIAIGGDSNFANEPGEKALFDINFPRGFDLNTGAITSPPGDGFAAVTDASIGTIMISERDNPNNSEEYSVTITLAAYNSPLTGNITATYGGMAATSIIIETTNVTIIGFTNNDTDTPEMGAVTIAETMIRTGYTVTPLSLEIIDPPGKAVTNTPLGMITVTNTRTRREIPHPVTVRFDGDIQLRIEGTQITGSPLENVNSETTIEIGGEVCQLLAAPTITIVNFPRGKIADATPFPLYYDSERDTLASGKFTVARKLTLEDVDAEGNATVLTSEFIIRLEFPECTTFAVGTGDSATPYEIDSAPRLNLMSHLVSSDRGTYGDRNYKLTANIDMGLAGFPLSEVGSKHPHEMGATGKGFYPIGIGADEINLFSGTLDCASKTISGLYINRLTNGVGLVGQASNATIKNCGLTDVNIKAGSDTGGLVGVANNNSMISNSYVTGSVTEIGLPGLQNTNAGGLVAFLGPGSSISDSYADVTLSAEGNGVGGLVGNVYQSAITNSYAIANVTGMDTKVGGLVGTIYTAGALITGSYAIGSITGTGSNVGGLVGEISDPAFIKDSYARVNVTGTGSNVGGLVGGSYNGTITNAYATGNVLGTGDNVGLFIGYNAGGGISPVAVGTGVTSSYFSTDAMLTVGDADQTDKKGVGSDTTGASPVTTANVTGRTMDQLRVSAIVPTGAASVYVDWDKDSMGMVLSDQVWNFTQNQYPRLINVVCANRQYNQDATACTSTLP